VPGPQSTRMDKRVVEYKGKIYLTMKLVLQKKINGISKYGKSFHIPLIKVFCNIYANYDIIFISQTSKLSK
jgi:hypothetical protein